MGAAWMRARAELRARWGAWLVLAILIGMAGGAVLTAAAGARRTQSVFQRLLAASRSADVTVQVNDDVDPDLLRRVASLPQVVASGRMVVVPSDDARPGTPGPFHWDVFAAAPVDRTIGETLDIPKLVGGRLPDAGRPHEALVSPDFVRARGVGIGDEFTIQLVTFPELFRLFGGSFPSPTGPQVTVRIVGVAVLPRDVSFVPEDRGTLYLTRAFQRMYGDRVATLDLMQVRLASGPADIPAFIEAARALAGPDVLGFETRRELIETVARALDVQATALWAFAGVLGVASLLILGQAVSRSLAIAGEDAWVVRAVGLTRGGAIASSLIPVAGVAVAGAIVAASMGAIASPLMPVGLARALEPEPGFALDAWVLVLGAAGLTLLTLARATMPAVSIARRAIAPGGDGMRFPPSRIAERFARLGMPASAVSGTRLATAPGRGATGVPVRSTLVGAAIGLLAVSAASTFDRSFDRMLETPASYGWNWDLVVFAGEDPALVAHVQVGLMTSPLVASVSRISAHGAALGGHDIQIVGIDQVEGAITLGMLDGRYPTGPDEVALGTSTMRALGKTIGDTVSFPGTVEACDKRAGCALDFTVVGRTMMWTENQRPSEGAAFTASGVARIRHTEGFSNFLVRLAPGVSRSRAARALEEQFGDVLEPGLTADLLNLDRVRSMPDALGGVLIVLALASLAHVLVTTLRRRARDLAVLKVMGFVRRQVRGTVAWLASLIIGGAGLMGLPAGVVVGRWAWRATASTLGIVEAASTPVTTILAGALAVFAFTNLVAMFPARAAARTKPALVLRSE